MLRQIGDKPLQTVVEIGAGQGELTRALLKRNGRFAHYYAFEIDDEACAYLHKIFAEITIKKENAFDFPLHLPEGRKTDLFLSSIPLSFYSKQKIHGLLKHVKESLNENGMVVIIFSAIWLIPVLRRQFKGAKIYPFLTFPPYFLLSYKAKK